MLGERPEMLLDPWCQRRRRVAVVVEVKLDFSKAASREPGELIEEVRSIFFAGEEPTVPWRPTVAVAKRAERGVPVGPDVDAGVANVVGGTTPQRLVVIAEREQDVALAARLWRARTPDQMATVVANPVLEVFFAKSG